MQHDFSIVFETDNPYWQRVLDIFEKNEKYPKKIVKNRNLHHKFPRSFSKILGEPVDNDKDNLISLSLADHFLVHYYYYLIAKKGYRQSMALAFNLMAKKGLKFITPETAEAMAKDYAEARAISTQYTADCLRGTHRSDETKQKIASKLIGRKGHVSAWKGKHLPEEMRKQISQTQLGREPWNKGMLTSDETKAKLREAKLGKKRKPFSEETKAKMAEARKAYWEDKRNADRLQ